MSSDEPPVVAEVVRSGFVEAVHRGSVFGMHADGTVAFTVGTTDSPVSPRSCNKPLQAVAMLRAGLEVDDRQLALVCSSHGGLPDQVQIAQSLLASVGLTDGALGNAPGWPLDEPAARALVAAGGEPDRVHHNCSGKHAGMLATCVTNGWPVETYTEADHPLQLRIRDTIEELVGEPVVAVAVDGCGAPLVLLSLRGLATGYRALVTAAPGTPEQRVAAAMRAHPDIVGGPGHIVTRLMAEVPGLLAKDGAEGAFAAALPDGRTLTVRITDGAARAVPPVVVAALRRLGLATDTLDDLGDVAVTGGGRRVGQVRAAF